MFYGLLFLFINSLSLFVCLSQFTELFQPYTQYCLQQAQCQQYCKDRYHDNEHFKLYLAVSIRTVLIDANFLYIKVVHHHVLFLIITSVYAN